MKNKVTITADKLKTILAFALTEVFEAQNLDDSYIEFAADMHREAFKYIFGNRKLPEDFVEQCEALRKECAQGGNPVCAQL